MDNLLTVAFEAHHDDLNCHRRYRITVGRDLLNDWIVTISYGRSGQGGQEKHFGGQSAEAMQQIVREHLRRRLSAPKRIGCAYRLTVLNAASDFEVSSWLAADVFQTIRWRPSGIALRGIYSGGERRLIHRLVLSAIRYRESA